MKKTEFEKNREKKRFFGFFQFFLVIIVLQAIYTD